MARTTSGRKGAGKKKAAATRAVARAAPKAKAPVRKKAAGKKAAVAPVRKGAARKLAAAPKRVVKKAAPKKAASRVPAKKAAARVPVARRPVVRRARAVVPVRRKAAAPRLRTQAPEQVFTVSHLNEADFRQDGLRSYALYRDLGVAAASGGLCQAHVIRLLSPCTDEVRQRHLHEPELQLIYVLKGWIKNEFDGQGVQMMSAGSCWLQPPGIKHTVLDYSADAELLEIIVPADFRTVDAA